MTQLDWQQYIESNPDILAGKPSIKGTRISVDHLMGLLAQGWTNDQILVNYPQVSNEAILAVFEYKNNFGIL